MPALEPVFSEIVALGAETLAGRLPGLGVVLPWGGRRVRPVRLARRLLEATFVGGVGSGWLELELAHADGGRRVFVRRLADAPAHTLERSVGDRASATGASVSEVVRSLLGDASRPGLDGLLARIAEGLVARGFARVESGQLVVEDEVRRHALARCAEVEDALVRFHRDQPELATSLARECMRAFSPSVTWVDVVRESRPRLGPEPARHRDYLGSFRELNPDPPSATRPKR